MVDTLSLFVNPQVVCRKLRSDHSESQHHQHLKAAKALFIIIPLLGMPYLITLLPPTDETSYFFIFFQHTRAVLLATQVSGKESDIRTDRKTESPFLHS